MQNGHVPELPEVEAIALFLGERIVGTRVAKVDLASIAALKTFDPPLADLEGRLVTSVHRRGKFLLVESDDSQQPLILATHLARAGWLQWRDQPPATPTRPGKGPLALRVSFVTTDGEPCGGFDITEAGTRKSLAIWLVRDESTIPRLATLGPEPLAPEFTPVAFAEILHSAGGAQIKGVLRDQSRIAGIGNAYSDEILHVARLSPFTPCKSLTDDSITALHAAIDATLRDAILRSAGQKPALLKSEKRAGMRVHGRAGQPCPVCNDTVREVSFADSALQYCPTCQTGGKLLADRRLSKFVK